MATRTDATNSHVPYALLLHQIQRHRPAWPLEQRQLLSHLAHLHPAHQVIRMHLNKGLLTARRCASLYHLMRVLVPHPARVSRSNPCGRHGQVECPFWHGHNRYRNRLRVLTQLDFHLTIILDNLARCVPAVSHLSLP